MQGRDNIEGFTISEAHWVVMSLKSSVLKVKSGACDRCIRSKQV